MVLLDSSEIFRVIYDSSWFKEFYKPIINQRLMAYQIDRLFFGPEMPFLLYKSKTYSTYPQLKMGPIGP